ncbi:MAG: amidohydrolase [Desulfobacteraceae bacterium]|nr:MAG: amidohydrolase [Desulfobacteraceae bacterium]
MLRPKLPSYNDPDGEHVPEGLPAVVDGHVHLFPPEIFAALWAWFDENAWPIRYRMAASEAIEHLLSRGVRHVVALQYAHKPGISRILNRFMAKTCSHFAGKVTGMAAVFPGEPDADQILREAFSIGLKGVKLHAHVHCFDLNAEEMNQIYALCASEKKPLVIHAGREPKSEAYRCDSYQICSAEKVKRILEDFPDLKLCVPHLGFDEISVYGKLVERFDNLWLDTTMMLAGYFPLDEPIGIERLRMERVMYGSDFPNIPYAWDRELLWVKRSGLKWESLEWLLHGSSSEFFGIELEAST